MKKRDIVELLLLAAMWGCSFLFMRIAVPQFGPVLLSELRLLLGGLVLLPFLWASNNPESWRQHWKAIAVVGIVNSAIPFMLLAYAAMSLTAGFVAILNSTTPLWGALIAVLWFNHALPKSRAVGLLIGFCGVVLLAWGRASFKPGGDGLAILAALSAALLYGIGTNYSKKNLHGVSPTLVASGSMLSGAVFLFLPALFFLPSHLPSPHACEAATALGIFCTGIAYILFYQIVANAGAVRSMTVIFLVPMFSVLFGFLFLSESITPHMLLGCAVILFGTALATGIIRWKLSH
jgi:drug/metabolite transporter (DMT)-like permease